MAISVRASAAYGRNLLQIVRPAGTVPLVQISTLMQKPSALPKHGPYGKSQHWSAYSSGVGPSDTIIKWIRKRLLTLLTLAGVAGGTVFIVSDVKLFIVS